MFKAGIRKSHQRPAVRFLPRAGAVALTVFAGGAAFAQSVPTSGPAENGQPAWFIYQAPPRAPGPGGPGAGPGGPAGAPAGFAPRAPEQIQACAADAAKLGIAAGSERNELMK